MIKIGIRAHDLGRDTIENLVQKAKNFGFEGFQLVFSKALSTPIDLNRVSSISSSLFAFPVFMLGSYFNLFHPDLAQVETGMAQFKSHLQIASMFEVPFVGTETGSYMGSPWGYHPMNHTQEALDQVILRIKDLVDFAEKHSSIVAIEGAYAHVAYNPKRIVEVLDRIQSPALKVIVDLYNYLHIGNHEQRMAILQECFDLFTDSIVIYHFKDYIIENNQLKQVGLGQGLMDYPKIIKAIKHHTPNAICIFEGILEPDLESSIQWIQSLLKEDL